MKAGRESSIHIGIYGRCNAGKSTFLNYITDADVALVSPEKGTTTDPVRRSYELSAVGPVVWIDTAGLDDTSALSELRLKHTKRTLSEIDLAVVVYRQWGDTERQFAKELDRLAIPYVRIRNLNGFPSRDSIAEQIRKALPENIKASPDIFGARVGPGDIVLLVCPVDSGAPVGRLILPQVQAIRGLLDSRAVAVVAQPSEVEAVLAGGLKPKLVVIDSQIFPEVASVLAKRHAPPAYPMLPENIELTSFSILLAAAKGDPALYQKGLEKIDALAEGDKILILENCLHQVSCEDIGRVKIPAWLQEYTDRKLTFTFIGGLSPLPEDISSYALAVQCGGCMVTRSQLQNRIRQVAAAGVPVTNYGMLIRKIKLG